MAFCADDASGSDEAAAGPGAGAVNAGDGDDAAMNADDAAVNTDDDDVDAHGAVRLDDDVLDDVLDEDAVLDADDDGFCVDAPERPGPGAGDFTQFSPPSLPLPRTISDGLTMSIRSLLRSDLGFVWLPVGSWPRTVRGSGLTFFREVSETA